MQIKIGSDPEFFLCSLESNTPVSPHEVTKGTKKEPEPLWDGWAIQIDGMAVEFNTPCFSSLRELRYNFLGNRERFEKLISDRLGSPHFLSHRSNYTFPDRVWDLVPAENKELGCSPDFSAYYEEVNPQPVPVFDSFRTTSGHISLGWIDPESVSTTKYPEFFKVCCALVRSLEYNIGTYHLRQGWVTERARLYGRPGAFRPKPFGLEWRPMTNFWLADTARAHEFCNRFDDVVRWLKNKTLKVGDMRQDNSLLHDEDGVIFGWSRQY